MLREKRKREVEELTTWVQGRVEEQEYMEQEVVDQQLMKYVRIPSQVRRSSNNTCWSTSHLSTSVTSVESRLRGLTICSDTWWPGACPPAKCNWCGRSFTRRSSLITHNLVAYLYTGWFF